MLVIAIFSQGFDGNWLGNWRERHDWENLRDAAADKHGASPIADVVVEHGGLNGSLCYGVGVFDTDMFAHKIGCLEQLCAVRENVRESVCVRVCV